MFVVQQLIHNVKNSITKTKHNKMILSNTHACCGFKNSKRILTL